MDADLAAWRRVPGDVARLAKDAAALGRLLAALAPIGDPDDRAWWRPADGGLHVQSRAKQAAWAAALAPGTAVAAFPPPGAGWVPVKAAAFLAPIARAEATAREAIGGPNPLTAAIVGGVAGAGLGHLAGWAGEKLLPEGQFERGRLRRTLALAGAGLGAAPGVVQGLAQARIPEAGGSEAPGLGKFLDPTPWLSGYGYRGEETLFDKAAADAAAGGLYLPSIPVDAFNRAVWNDVGAAPNAFGTKDPWGTDDQPLRTPPAVASFASGVVAGAGAAAGRSRVSPMQVAATAGAAAGVGYLGGVAFGKTLGVLAGLKPESQERLQQAGLWGGLITGAVNSLFR